MDRGLVTPPRVAFRWWLDVLADLGPEDARRYADRVRREYERLTADPPPPRVRLPASTVVVLALEGV